jgi:hypothetical protein
MDTTDITDSLSNLTALDRCDSCGAQAYVQVFLGEGDLLFCGHHFKEHEHKLLVIATKIHDEMHKLIPSKPEPEDVE